ncbi:sulfotransferase domain-containing protein [Pacificibacter sp. AS14]|uniref:sulfotransferase domain-containing protein n=1 Tax=Pacificibacter sp. AS14 TaxID=3135785 RepID=UPI00316E2FAF
MIDFIILGAQKAATSALQDSLRLHPSVFMPMGESPFFEDPDFASQPWETFSETAPSGTIKGIKRPDYLCSDQAIERISTALPECKFIVVLREPISRTISSYCYMVRHAHLPALPLNVGLAECLRAYEAGENSRAATVISYSLYGAYLDKWFQAYPKENFLVLPQKSVGENLRGALVQCLEHIGVEGDASADIAIKAGESNVGLYDPKMLKIARIGSLLKTRPIKGSYRREPRSIPMRAFGSLFSKYAEARALQKQQIRETLSTDLTEKLTHLFDRDLETLEALLDARELGWK